MASLPASGAITAIASNAAGQTLFEQLRDWLSQLPASAEVQLTISAGSITPATRDQGSIKVETEAAAASDDLSNIATTNVSDGGLLLLRAANASHTVVVKHAAGGAGQMALQYDADFSLDDTDKWLLIKRVGADWIEVNRCWGNDPAAERAAIGILRTCTAAAGGTVDAITATFSPPFAAHTQDAIFAIEAGGANTSTTPTFSPDGLTAKTIVKGSNQALAAGDISGANYLVLLRYDSSLDKYQLINPYISNVASGMPRGYIAGLTLANNGTDATNDIDIAAGAARDSTNAADIVLASGLTKQLDAGWTVGTNAGGLDTGTVANNTYHVWLIKRSDTGVVDVLFSLSATAPTMPTNYDYKRRIGSIVRAGGVIRPFIQSGNLFHWKTRIADVNTAISGTTANTRTLSLPTGIKVRADIAFGIHFAALGSAVSNYGVASDLSETDSAASASLHDVKSAGDSATYMSHQSVNKFVVTNTSAQIRTRWAAAGGNEVTETLGWVDYQLSEGA